MTQKQFDTIYLQIKKLSNKVALLEEQLTLMNTSIKSLSDKTMVITSIDQDIVKLKTDIASLLDEQEA